uniref:WRKY70 n=1 Tax=Populus alba var. pyramidalis TaxID=327892 RepID=A0A5P9NYQ9_POPAL|nr:WRKY70 [Populus alba var. pyramidalis]
MESSWPENLPSHRKKVVDELLRGQEIAKQLKFAMSESTGDDGSMSAENLVKEIMNSFSTTLSILNGGGYDDDVSQTPATTKLCSPPCYGRKSSEDSGESSKSTATVKVKDRRGCYKRRRSSHSWTKETSTLTDDGHAWRKYGQKMILNAKYPRNYYRCTHKFDQQCQATKQVQRVEEEPPLYRTTYHGYHSCKSLLKASDQFVLDPTGHFNTDSSTLLSFKNSSNHHQMTTTNCKQNHPFFITSLPSIKQEYYKEEGNDMPGYDPTIPDNQALSSDYLLPTDDHDRISTFDHGDVISGVNSSCTTSSHSLDIDSIMAESVGFGDGGDVLGFEFCA